MNRNRINLEFESQSRLLKKFLSRKKDYSTKNYSKKLLPKISVIMPSFNHDQYIERSLISVINQGYPNLELIVIDGKSSDNTSLVIDKYKEHISFYRSKEDKGQSDALNYGFSKATGEIFSWLNSDDVYMPGALFAAADAFQNNSSAKIVFGDWWSIDSEDSLISINYAFDFNINHFIYEGFHLNSQAMFWKKNVHENFGNFDIELHKTMDYEMILSFGENEGENSFLRVPKVLACFRRHEEQKSFDENDPVILSEQIKTAIKHNIYNKKYGLFRPIIRFIYRIRRAWWYFKRAGVIYLSKQIFK